MSTLAITILIFLSPIFYLLICGLIGQAIAAARGRRDGFEDGIDWGIDLMVCLWGGLIIILVLALLFGFVYVLVDGVRTPEEESISFSGPSSTYVDGKF